jgi:type II secretory pathway pseudopilin PulG
MLKKRWFVLAALIIAGLLLVACGGGAAPAVDTGAVDEAVSEAEARIAELEAQLAEAEGGASEEDVAALQAELEDAQAAADEAKAEAQAAAEAQCSYNAYRMGWVMDYSDPVNIVNEVFAPTSDSNYTFWGNTYPDEAAAFEELVAQAVASTDAEERVALWQQAENIVVNDTTVVIPIFLEL